MVDSVPIPRSMSCDPRQRAGGRRFARRSLAGIMLAGVGILGCTAPPAFRAAIHSENPDDRILGIRAAAAKGDSASIPLIVDRLEDQDSAVRFYAILALDHMTGGRMGYDYAASAAERAESVTKWRAAVRSGGLARTEDRASAATSGASGS